MKITKSNKQMDVYSDSEMINFLKNRGKSEQDIRSYEKIGSFLKKSYLSADFSFGPYFSESISSRIQNLSKNSIILDIADDLSQIFTKVAAFAFFVVFLIILYSYVTQGDISGVISMDPETLNDTRLISSVLFNY